ncbi:MAG: hypothetical protein CM15mV12_0320 [uncultured marine virus]|nr:MAG: hypothetical protein CM15mV12_0320 [uncultured marine virus]
MRYNYTSGLLGNNSIAPGDSFAVTFATAAAQTGSSFPDSRWYIFYSGNFVNVATETLILDQYGTHQVIELDYLLMNRL